MIAVGDYVTTHGRAGAGQPVVTGKVVAIDGPLATIELQPGVTRKRSLRNLRRLPSDAEVLRTITSSTRRFA